MKLVRKVSLAYQEGRSDKVYEVDLCEVGPDQYVVNYRYGRRGMPLRDGTKTNQGYREKDGAAAAQPPNAPRVPVSAEGNEARQEAILNRLRGDGKKFSSKWPLERVIWRAGELRLREAVPQLMELTGSQNNLREYCLAWALGRCGDEAAIPWLARLHSSTSHPDHVRCIAA